jgi:hypothetical protein
VRRQIQRSHEPRPVDERQRGMDLLEKDLVPDRSVKKLPQNICNIDTYSSCMTSSGGMGSSSPRLIISHWNSCSSPPFVLLRPSFWYVGLDAFLESRRFSSEVSKGFDDCVRVVGAPCCTVLAT